MEKHIEAFRDYLDTLDYSPQISYELPNTIRRIFNHIQKPISKITKTDLEEYIEWLKSTESKRTHRPLSNIQINSYIYALKHFAKYLYATKGKDFPIHHLTYLKLEYRTNRIPLTIEEIQKLYEVTDNNTKYGMRDRAMLTIFYGCGLRRNEGISLELNDINLNKKVLFVRNGKMGTQRYVPFTEQSKKHLEEYIHIGRKRFIQKAEHRKRNTFFISRLGKALDSQSLLNSLRQLTEKANIDKNIGLHTLRHSIATHLLKNGMGIDSIAEFLGHSSLESTQVYTHIVEDEILKMAI